MRPGIRAEIWRFCYLGLAVLVCGKLSGYPLQVLLLFFTSYLVWAYWSGIRLLKWIGTGMGTESSVKKSFWAEVQGDIGELNYKRVNQIQKMRHSVKRISQIAHTIDGGILVLKKDLKIDWWNAAARKQLNLKASDQGRPLYHLIRDPEFVEYIKQEEFSDPIELPSFVHPNQWLLFSASHFAENDIVIELTDITRLKNMETLRKEFVGNVSHELRTPITVLRGYLETLGDGLITDNLTVQKACKQMSEQVVRMQALADDLIILSRLESDSVEVKEERIQLKPLLQLILDEAKIVSDGRHKISMVCSEQAYIIAGTGELYSALSNLVLNAVRHNPLGANISIVVSLREEALEVSINDDGVGISSESIPRLTERFYRTDSSRNSNVGGTGLGLAIVKHVINRNGGELIIKSRIGEGAEFICRFPSHLLGQTSV